MSDPGRRRAGEEVLDSSLTASFLSPSLCDFTLFLHTALLVVAGPQLPLRPNLHHLAKLNPLTPPHHIPVFLPHHQANHPPLKKTFPPPNPKPQQTTMASILKSLRPLGKLATPTRGLATPSTAKALFTPILPQLDPAALHLITGQSYEGNSFGSKKSAYGETVFSTSITSCEC